MPDKHPILFSASMVLAILAGNKTQTRMVVRLNAAGRVKEVGSHRNWHLDDPEAVKAAPWKVGDTLWVKEAWHDDLCPRTDFDNRTGVYYRADGEAFEQFPEDYAGMRWRSPLFMPRWASRITLLVKSVRVERLQSINEDDAIAEGVRRVTKDGTVHKYCVYDRRDMSSVPWQDMPRTAVERYTNLWDSINGKKHPWASNPWVWVIEFERKEANA